MPLTKKVFKDDFDKGIKKPTDYTYVKYLRFKLKLLNLWPGREIGENDWKYRNIISIAHIGLMSSYFVAGNIYMRNNIETLSFIEAGHVAITISMGFVALMRMLQTTLSHKCRNVFVTFLKTIHLFYHKNISDYAMQTHKTVNFILQGCTIMLFGQWVVCMLSFNCIPAYRNYVSGKFQHKILSNSTYEHSVYIQFPFDAYTKFNGYLVASFINLICTYTCSSWFIMLDLMLFFIVFHVWGHYKILLHDLSAFPLPGGKEIIQINNEYVSVQFYSEQELKIISNKLKECINYHIFITDFINKMSDAFGSILFVYYTFYQTSLCLLLLECSQMTTQAVMLYGPMTVVLFQQLIQISVTFELIGTASEKLKDAVYGVPWEYMDASNRRTVAIFLVNVQEPVHINALGLARVGVTSMVTIIKTSFTYFTFLSTF